MTFDSLVNRGDYFSAHYLAEVLPKDLKSGLLAEWKQREEDAAGAERPEGALPVTPRAGLRALRRTYFAARSYFTMDEERAATGEDAVTYDAPEWRDRVRALNGEVLRALGFDAKPGTLTVVRADQSYEVTVAHAEKDLVALDCGWSAEPDDALDPDGAGRLLDELRLDGQHTVATGSKLASFLFACEDAPRYVLLLVGGVVVLADRAAWGEGRYLAVSLDASLERNDTKAGGELDTVAALFGADSLRTPEEGGENPLATLVDKSTKHAVGVSSELRDGLRLSVELIANEVLDRVREGGVRPEEVKELPELGRQLTRESLRYLYRILFLLYAEARPELGILPSDYPEYQLGYGLGRLGELIAERDLVDEKSRKGFYLYESLDLLFSKVQEGYRPRRTHGMVDEKASEDVGLRFEPLHSKLFEPEAIRLIGARAVPDPRVEGETGLEGGERFIDTRLRNETLYRVLRLLMLTRGKKRERGGFISYAQLGINQLGAVYEGLMSYSGFVAGEELYEVAKHGDPKDGSWLVPAAKADEYPDEVFVRQKDEDTGEERRVRHAAGSFVYRLSGRDRQTSASYYTPESLTRVTVQLALQHRLDQDDTVTEARELLEWKICEPALGSGAFLNEAINQVAAEYLRRRQDELGVAIDTEKYAVELQKAKAYIALHNSYGVDLNNTAVELAEVSLWLNTMHPGMEAPWFGLHLRRGNSLIGGRREVYSAERLKKGGWLGATPERFPLSEAVAGVALPEGAVHHFLLPAKEWGAVAAEKEAKALAPAEAKTLGAWRKAITKSPSAAQTKRLQGLARRAEYLWGLVVRRLEISEREISRRVDVWGAEEGWLRSPEVAVPREKVKADLEAVDTPYWRLKTLMDAWCALWFWPVQEAALLDGSHEAYVRAAEVAAQSAGWTVSAAAASVPGQAGAPARETYEREDLLGTVEVVEIKSKGTRGGSRKEQIRGERRPVIALASLEDWLDFAESLLGTQDVAADSLGAHFNTLDEIERHEDELPEWMGMERFTSLESRYPWAGVARDVAERQGFFHWELEFGQVFAAGGYDLQVGNPPWVRPDWHEDAVLAEVDPWFALTVKPPSEERKLRKTQMLDGEADYYLGELAENTGIGTFVSSAVTYPLSNGTRPNLYRVFMCTVWKNQNLPGISALIHQDSHFDGGSEGPIREESYRRLLLHAGFVNAGNWAFEAGRTLEFGIHVYGQKGVIDFVNISQLYGAQVLPASLKHDGSGPIPGQKYEGAWDLRPHAARKVRVTEAQLSDWRDLDGRNDIPIAQTPMRYPITTAEQGAISALSAAPARIKATAPWFSRGHDANAAKQKGILHDLLHHPTQWQDAILQGSHISTSTPFAKQPNMPMRNSKDWSPWELDTLDENAIPNTLFARSGKHEDFVQEQETWVAASCHTHPTDHFRLAWRRMIDAKSTERSLFATLIPPGPTHNDSIFCVAWPENRRTVAQAGLWASLPMDYLLRLAGRSNFQTTDAEKMPTVHLEHPLIQALTLRTLRLNCLTRPYAPLWNELYSSNWQEREEWAYADWANIQPLASTISEEWSPSTPLRNECERRAALVELDSLTAVMFGISADELVAIYRSRYPILSDREKQMYFDNSGRRIAADPYAFGHRQTKQDYINLLAHLEAPETITPPAGYTAPFYKADRETEMRAAHAHFQARLDKEIAAGRWTPTGSRKG
ncbi:hypothetical protein [Streptomyces sp. NRRL WC-3626]|uniref:hypothetical protein n=1 Tax=Streptomyces sp. NRRL WC-3626 TaxID=1463926 RepID=UPI0004C0B985|nr:hypothetical protein [Streptomyces sp. NRRL WC-3626]